MPTPIESLPPLLQRMVLAKRGERAKATPEEIAEADAFQKRQRTNWSAKRALTTQRTRTIITMFLACAARDAIAEAAGIKITSLENSFRRLGLPFRQAPFRALVIPAASYDEAVLVDVANAFDLTPDEAFQEVMGLQAKHAFEDGGLIARRVLRSRIRGAK